MLFYRWRFTLTFARWFELECFRLNVIIVIIIVVTIGAINVDENVGDCRRWALFLLLATQRRVAIVDVIRWARRDTNINLSRNKALEKSKDLLWGVFIFELNLLNFFIIYRIKFSQLQIVGFFNVFWCNLYKKKSTRKHNIYFILYINI